MNFENNFTKIIFHIKCIKFYTFSKIYMKKILLITANPSSQGFTHKIAQKYSDASKQNWHEVELLDLYAEENAQDYLAYENIRTDWPNDEKINAMQKKIAWADELMFVAPVWWGSVPAVMKNFIDVNFQSGFAFKYNQKGKVVGLLKGKTAGLIMTSDAPGFIYKYLPFMINLKGYFKINILNFCGIKMTKYALFDTMHKRKKSPEKIADILAYVEKLAKKS